MSLYMTVFPTAVGPKFFENSKMDPKLLLNDDSAGPFMIQVNYGFPRNPNTLLVLCTKCGIALTNLDLIIISMPQYIFYSVFILVAFNALIASRATDVVTNSVRCSTTKGDISIDIYRDWAPLGADRFIELVRDGFFQEIGFFRCVKGFLTQCRKLFLNLKI